MVGRRLRVRLVFSGRSCEHAVSIASAASVMANLDRNKYEIIPLGITKAGSWLLGTEPAKLLAAEQNVQQGTEDGSLAQTRAVTLTGDPSLRRLIAVQGNEQLGDNGKLEVIFPGLPGID